MKDSRAGFTSALLLVWLVILASIGNAQADDEVSKEGYRIQPGDVLRVSVWKEQDLQQDLLVRPDGGISFPLAGDIRAAGQTLDDVRSALVSRIEQFIPDPVITVQAVQLDGNVIYVLGKVNRPGAFVMSRPLDVTQALALAGGMATFAEQGNILILRRDGTSQVTLEFDYDEVQYGRRLEQNVLLQPGDVVVVP